MLTKSTFCDSAYEYCMISKFDRKFHININYYIIITYLIKYEMSELLIS